jgi:hypothetical protein
MMASEILSQYFKANNSFRRMKLSVAILVITIAFGACFKKDENSEQITTSPVEIVRVDNNIYVNDGVETFTFFTDGVENEGLIYLPEDYESNSNLPAIYLLDYQEQDFAIATDEFAQLINAVREMPNFDALVVSLKGLPNTDAFPITYKDYSDVIKDMSYHVDSIYTDNASKTLVARGSEGGVVLLTLLNEDPENNVFENYIATDSPTSFNSNIIGLIEGGTIPPTMLNKKLHFSFSSSNNFESCNELINSFEEAQYPWLTFESKYYNGLYNGVYPAVFTDGLQFIFD